MKVTSFCILIALIIIVGGCKHDTHIVPIIEKSINEKYLNDSIRISGKYSGMRIRTYQSPITQVADTNMNYQVTLLMTDSTSLSIYYDTSTTAISPARLQDTIGRNTLGATAIFEARIPPTALSPDIYQVYIYPLRDSVYVRMFTTYSNQHTEILFWGRKH